MCPRKIGRCAVAPTIILLAGALALCRAVYAQQAPSEGTDSVQGTSPQALPGALDTAPAAVNQPSANPNSPKPNSSKDDRLFWTLPNLLTVEGSTQPAPLTAGQKFKLVAESTFDPVQFAFIGMVTSVNQLSNTNPSFGQGMVGYSKRYALALGDNVTGNFMTAAVFPSLFHQDPRYYQMGRGKFVRRAWYAGTRVFVTRSDGGRSEFNFSEILGNGTAAVVSNAYHPGPRTVVSNVDILCTQVGWDAASYELKEFWPDIHHFLRPRK